MIDRTDQALTLLAETQKLCVHYCADVGMIMAYVRAKRPVMTELALHFVELSMTEIVRGRSMLAQLMLLNAVAVLDAHIALKLLAENESVFASTHDIAETCSCATAPSAKPDPAGKIPKLPPVNPWN